MEKHFKSESWHVEGKFKCLGAVTDNKKPAPERAAAGQAAARIPGGRDKKNYLKNAAATPPSTFSTFPVDLFSKPPTNTKHALAISSGKMASFIKVLFA